MCRRRLPFVYFACRLRFFQFYILCIYCMSSVRLAKGAHGSELPAEYELIRLLSDVSNPLPSWNEKWSVREWHGVTCDKEHRVISIFWHELSLKGSVLWQHLPWSLSTLTIRGNRLEGRVPTDLLPRGLRSFDIQDNLFYGEFFTETLPNKLQHLHIERNRFCGNINLRELPRSLLQCRLGKNLFNGTIDLSRLPPNLEELTAEDNLLDGTLSLKLIPESLIVLSLAHNRLSGEINLTEVNQKTLMSLGGNVQLKFILRTAE